MRKCGATSLKLDTHSTDHMTHIAILPCIITHGYLWVRYMWLPGTQVQSHLLQELLCKYAYVIKPGSYGTSPLHGITKPSVFKYWEHFYLILFPKTSLKDYLLHLTLLNQRFGQQSNSETHVACMNRVGCCRDASQMLCTNSTHTYTKPLPSSVEFLLLDRSLHGPLEMSSNPIQITIRLCQ